MPELDDLTLRQRIAVKDYDETLTNMNERQIAAFNRVFRKHRDTLGYFGYGLMNAA